ncbi:MAG: DUF3794 domain-containing protein [Clostridiaceae bacterium]|nr:DUF3794 domain-containing protein [Clostridiaceae bacterium]
MSVELIKRPVNVYQTIDEQQKEELIETGIIVPDSKPDVMEVLVVDSNVNVKTREKTGKVMEVGGEINYQVVYRADNQNQDIETINVKAPWSVSCNYPAREEDVYTLVRSSIEHTDVEIANGRKLSAKSVLKLNVKYLVAKSVEAGEMMSGDQVYQRSDTREVSVLEDIGEKAVNVSENAELPEGKPEIQEILCFNSNIRDLKVHENMSMECVLELDFLYRPNNNDKDVENVHMEFPVNKNLEIENFDYSDANVNANVKSVSVKPDEDIDGLLTRVRIDAEIGVEYILYSKENVHLVNDAYSTDFDFELEKKSVTLCVEERDLQDTLQVTGKIQLDCGGEPVEEIVYITVKPRLLSAEKDGSDIEVNGSLDICMLYVCGIQNRILRGSNQEIQFTHRIPLPECDCPYEYDVVMTADGFSYEIVSDDEVEIKAQVFVKAHISKKQQLEVVTGVKEIRPAEKKENPPLLIYYAQQGDNLWKIAKRYKVPVQKILEDNRMAEEKELEAGQKILLIG